MLQTLIFISVLGIAGFLFSKVEHTSYVDGLYWMVTTTLLIGFGDITPHTVVMRVLAFPLIIICVILLALIVTSIVHILSDRARRRKLEMKQRLKKKLSERNRLHAIKRYSFNPWRKKGDVDELRLRRSPTLQEELEKLRNDEERREMRASLKSVAIGFGVFLLFWFVGALIFHLVEVLTFDRGVELSSRHGLMEMLFTFVMCMRFVHGVKIRLFLTIGFGDFAPSTEAGRPIFIVYALLAVPTITTISNSTSDGLTVVQTTVTNCVTFTLHGTRRQRKQVYAGKHLQIHSLNSLVKMAKERTIERVDASISSLPLLEMTNRLMTNLEVMHHHLQSLLIQKLSPDARNVIAAERARQAKTYDFQELRSPHLIGMAPEYVNDLELLNEYRKRYADILGELLVAKDRLLELERGLQDKESKKMLTSNSKEKKSVGTGHNERRRNVSSSVDTSSDSDSEAVRIEV